MKRRTRIPIAKEEGMQGSLENWRAGEEEEEVIRCLFDLHVATRFRVRAAYSESSGPSCAGLPVRGNDWPTWMGQGPRGPGPR